MKVLLSIKPKYAEKILTGEKGYEFRKSIFKNASITKVVLYASSPIQKVVGEFDIEHIISLHPDDLWENTKHHAGIDKNFFDKYFCGKNIAHAIKVKKSNRYITPKDLREYGINFPPQSYCYI